MREVSGFSVKFEPGRVAPVGIDLERIQTRSTTTPRDGRSGRVACLCSVGMPFSDQAHEVPRFLASRFPSGIFQRGWIFGLIAVESSPAPLDGFGRKHQLSRDY